MHTHIELHARAWEKKKKKESTIEITRELLTGSDRFYFCRSGIIQIGLLWCIGLVGRC